jgi:aspartyl-tRNA(Asn)/glutamyl-tRNA(Gln) amidotransferase subunit A
MIDLKTLTLSDAVRMIELNQVSSTELNAAVLSRIDKLNPGSCAFITVMKPEHAKGATRTLHAVPISVKDLYDTKGVRTTAGSKVFAERIPEEDAAAVRKLKDAGAVIIGKTNLHEFAFGVTTINPHYGIARNPWDRDRISGGSSGGSASAVALGMGLGSLGSDTGGSIRIPASLCGIVGLKPTYGRVSLRGVIPLAWSLDHAGPMTRTVRDSAMLLQIVAESDPQALPYTEALTGNIAGLRVGIPTNYFYEQLESSVERAVRTALNALERLGARLVHIEVPGIAIHRAAWFQIASAEAYSYHEFLLQKHAALYGTDVRARLEAGKVLLSVDYVRSQRARTLIKQQCAQLFESVDVLVTPTVPIPAPRIDEIYKPWGGGPETAVASLTRLTRFFNLVGLPAISIPCGFTDDNLPIGLQIVGKAFDEFTVLRTAHAYEQSAEWFQRVPEM